MSSSPLSLTTAATTFVLACLLPFATFAAPADAPTEPAPVGGVDYAVIPGGQPFSPRDGRIEVAEIFGYTCPHCAHFEPQLQAWKAGLADDVKLVPVPAPFGGHWIPYAEAWFAAQSLGLDERSHAAMYRALHVEGRLPISGPTPQELAAFYAEFGADPQQFIKALDSAEVAARLQQSRDFIERSFDGAPMFTPTIVVAGKYRVTGRSAEDVLHIAKQLVERERERATGGG